MAYLLLDDYKTITIDLITDWLKYKDVTNTDKFLQNLIAKHHKDNKDFLQILFAEIEIIEDWYDNEQYNGQHEIITVPWHENGETETIKNMPYQYDDNGEHLLKNGKRIKYLYKPVPFPDRQSNYRINKQDFEMITKIFYLTTKFIREQNNRLLELKRIIENQSGNNIVLGFDSKRTETELKIIHNAMVDAKYIKPNVDVFIKLFSGKNFELNNPIVWTLYRGKNPSKIALQTFLRDMFALTDIEVHFKKCIDVFEKVFVDKNGNNIRINSQDRNSVYLIGTGAGRNPFKDIINSL